MDVMMKMTTEDVRRLRAQFSGSLSLEQFVPLMKMNLRDRITNELEFLVGAVELFHTIDVNGDRKLEWDEFAGYMLDAGQARADFASDSHEHDSKLYQCWDLPFRDLKTPMNRIKTYVQQLLFLADLPAIAYFEHASDVVYIYALQFDQNEAPRYLATIRLHTAFQEHVVLDMCYVPGRKWLAISSMCGALAYLSVWQIPELSSHSHSPMMLRRIELESFQEQLTWLPTLQLLATASAVFPAVGAPSSSQKTTKIHQLLLWDLATLTTLRDFDHRERIKGVTSLVGVTTPSNRVFLVIGREDGQLTVVETESARDVLTLDAHGHGVRMLVHSAECELLASAGAPAYADETTHHIVIWRIEPTGGLRVEATLRDHNAPLRLLQFVDSKRQLLSADMHGAFHIYSTTRRSAAHDSWSCLQVFHAAHRVSECVVVPESVHSDAVLVAAGAHVTFHDLCTIREREEIIFTFYCRELNLILAVTASTVLLWRADSGSFWKSFSYTSITQSTPPSGYSDAPGEGSSRSRSITAACVDDRERKLLLGDDRGSVRVVNVVNGTVTKALDPHHATVHWLSYVLHSKRVISVSLDGVLHVCDENNPVGFYVPFGASKPQSVLLQSLRFLPDMAATDPSVNAAKFEVMRATGNQALDLLAVLMAGTQHGESFVQLWNFDLTHPQGTCIAPQQQEITCVGFVGSSGAVVGGTATGKVYLWSTMSADSTTYQCLAEFRTELEEVESVKDNNNGSVESDPDRSSAPPSIPSATATAQILHVLTLSTDPSVYTAEDHDESPETATFLTADGAPNGATPATLPMLNKTHSIDERLRREAEDGLFVVVADENGVITVWRYVQTRRHPTARHTPIPTLHRSNQNNPALFQHEEMAMSYEAVASLQAKAAERVAKSQHQHQVVAVYKAEARWKAHGTAITTLRQSSGDPLVLLSSCSSGKVKIWSLNGELLGVLDHFATRRVPERRPWRLAVDMDQRRLRKEAFAMQFLDRNSSTQSDKRPTARMSVLQERLSLTPEEMVNERASLTSTPNRTRRRITTVVQLGDVNRAIRHLALAQTRTKLRSNSPTRERARTISATPVPKHEPSLHALLTELNGLHPPTAAPAGFTDASLSVASSSGRRRFSMVTIDDLKHALQPRSRVAKGKSSAAVHCDFPATSFTHGPREVVVTATNSTLDGRLELADLRQESAARGQLNQESEAKPLKNKADGLLNYHVKLAHSWNKYAT